jgi:hypothetical protein
MLSTFLLHVCYKMKSTCLKVSAAKKQILFGTNAVGFPSYKSSYASDTGASVLLINMHFSDRFHITTVGSWCSQNTSIFFMPCSKIHFGLSLRLQFVLYTVKDIKYQDSHISLHMHEIHKFMILCGCEPTKFEGFQIGMLMRKWTNLGLDEIKLKLNSRFSWSTECNYCVIN